RRWLRNTERQSRSTSAIAGCGIPTFFWHCSFCSEWHPLALQAGQSRVHSSIFFSGSSLNNNRQFPHRKKAAGSSFRNHCLTISESRRNSPRRQFFHQLSCRQGVPQLAHSPLENRMPGIWRNFGQRLEYKSPLVHSRVGDRKRRQFYHRTSKQQ